MQDDVTLTILEQDLIEFKRLDALLVKKLPHLSRTLIKKLFEEGHFTSQVKLELKKMPTAPCKIMFTLPGPVATDIVAQEIPLDILFEDKHLLIVNKKAGMVVHPAPGNPDKTLVNAVLFHCKDLKGIGNEKRPGIVHRLDKGTSGIMVVAKDQQTHEGLVDLFSKHHIKRQYQAIVLGSNLPDKTTLQSTIGRSSKNRLKMSIQNKNGKNAITHLKRLATFQYFSHVELTLETGRTHQIRVHLAEMQNTPILNDLTYGKRKEEQYLMSDKMKELINNYEHPFLHARLLGFIHPITKKELLFEQDPPQIFKDALMLLGPPL